MSINCQACGKANVASAGRPIRTGGQELFPLRCPDCGFFWSQPKNPFPVKPVRPPVNVEDGSEFPPVAVSAADLPSHLRDADDMTSDAIPSPTERIVRAADGFKASSVRPGDVVLFVKGGQECQLTVVSVAPKSVLGDVDGKPDQRIRKDKLLGKVVLE